MTWQIETIPFDHPEADQLRRAQRRELDARYGSDDHEPGAVPTASDVPVFIVAHDPDGRAVACGGLRPLDDAVVGPDTVEIKRMFVERTARGSGVATAVLRALEDAARGLGARRVVLETGTLQPDAIRFYEREGYETIPGFGPYAGADLSVCYSRDLR